MASTPSSVSMSLIAAFPDPPSLPPNSLWIKATDPLNHGHGVTRTVLRNGEIDVYVPFDLPPDGLRKSRLPPGVDVIDSGPVKDWKSYRRRTRTRVRSRSRTRESPSASSLDRNKGQKSHPSGGSSWYTSPPAVHSSKSQYRPPLPPAAAHVAIRHSPFGRMEKNTPFEVSRYSTQEAIARENDIYGEVRQNRLSVSSLASSDPSIYSQPSFAWNALSRCFGSERGSVYPSSYKAPARRTTMADIREMPTSTRQSVDGMGKRDGRWISGPIPLFVEEEENAEYKYPKWSRHPQEKPMSLLERAVRFIQSLWRRRRANAKGKGKIQPPDVYKMLPRPPPEAYPQDPPPGKDPTMAEIYKYSKVAARIRQLDRTALGPQYSARRY